MDECVVFSDLHSIFVKWPANRGGRKTEGSLNDGGGFVDVNFVCEADRATSLGWLETGRVVVAAESGCHRIISVDLVSGKKTVLVGSGVAGRLRICTIHLRNQFL
jgi:hypothetical protein